MVQTQKSNRGIYILIALAVAGLVLSWLLTGRFYDIREGASGFKSICNLGDAINCDAVAASPYAEFIGGLPLSSFAAGWYVALIVVSAMALIADWRREALRGALVITGIGTIFSIFYLIVMATVIHSYCLYCLIIDGVNVAALVTVLMMKPESRKTHPLEIGKWKTMGWVVAGSILVALVMLKQLEGRPIDRTTIKLTADSVLSGQPQTVSVSDDVPFMGDKQAPITIVEFLDFQCPGCRMGALTLHGLQQRYPGKIRVILRNYPLDPACNPSVQRSMHPAACEAAKTAICAHKAGKFAKVYEELFEHQATLHPGKPAQHAQEAGMDGAQLASCVSSNEVSAAVARDIEEGNRLGIHSTPTFFINGYKVEGAFPLPVWSEIVERLLARR